MGNVNAWYVRLAVLTCLVLLLLPTGNAFMNSEGRFTLTSPSIKDGGSMSSTFGCRGQNISPELQWENPPAGTKTFKITLQNGINPWTLWIISGIPASYTSLPENIPMGATWRDGIYQEKNSWGHFGYEGPCPNGTVPFYFTIEALDENRKVLKKAVLNFNSHG